jgi:hypothetical protein
VSRERQIDALLAKHLMGCAFSPLHGEFICGCRDGRHDDPDRLGLRRYSTTWEGMGEVVEAMHRHVHEDGSMYFLALDYRGLSGPGCMPRWNAAFWRGTEQCSMLDDVSRGVDADTAPLAVALAALRALGVAVPGEGESDE